MCIFVYNKLLITKAFFMIKIKKIPLSKLLKSETRRLLDKVVEIVEKNNPEKYRLQDFHKILVEQQTKVKGVIKPYGKHKNTNDLAQLHQKRLGYASLIVSQVESLRRVNCPKTQRMVEIAKVPTKAYLTNLGRKNRHEVYLQLWAFFEILQKDESIQQREAFATLGLQKYLDDLKDTCYQYDDLHWQRLIDIKERPSIDGVQIRSEAQRILQLFFEQVNIYQKTFKEIDYEPIIIEINRELTRHSKNIKTRVATNKRRARKKAAAAAKLKEEVSKAKDNLKIEPEPKVDDEQETNANTKFDKSATVDPLNIDSSRNTTKSKKKDKKGEKGENIQDKSDKNDAESTGGRRKME